MEKIAEALGRLLGVLIRKGIITTEDALYILDPLKKC